jgi:hypothetical protein
MGWVYCVLVCKGDLVGLALEKRHVSPCQTVKVGWHLKPDALLVGQLPSLRAGFYRCLLAVGHDQSYGGNRRSTRRVGGMISTLDCFVRSWVRHRCPVSP